MSPCLWEGEGQWAGWRWALVERVSVTMESTTQAEQSRM